MSTIVVESDSIALGLAKVYLASSLDYIGDYEPVLTVNEYFCGLAKVALNMSKELKTRYSTKSGISMPAENMVTGASMQIDLTFYELKKKTLSYALGGDNSEDNIINDLLADPVDLRAELVFTYPNKINKMIVVFPKCNMDAKSIKVAFNESDAVKTPISISNLHYDVGAWALDPYGRVKFI